MYLLTIAAVLAVALLSPVKCNINPNTLCLQVEERRNQKDQYPNPTDCHIYYQCYYSGNDDAIGVERRCQQGYFFDSSALACVEEGPVKCTRLHELIADRARLTETSCRDTFGNILHSDPEHPDRFRLEETTLPCPEGRFFDLGICQCDNAAAEPSELNKKQCQLWLPFDEDMLDRSVQKFQTFPSGDISLDTENFFNGEASLRLKHGRLRIQGMKALDLPTIGVPNSASWCFFFRCEGQRTYDCLHEGGIISNSKDANSDFTIVAAVRPNNKLDIRIGTSPQVTQVTALVNWKQAGWNHVCVVLENEAVRVYVNAELAKTQPLSGSLMPFNHQPYVIGSDRTYGNFIGNIDDVVACAHALGEDEIQALYNGDHDALRRDGLFP